MCAHGQPLTHLHTGGQAKSGGDGGARPVLSEGVGRVVHDGAKVVRDVVGVYFALVVLMEVSQEP